MNLISLLQMTKPQAAQQQSEGLGPIMQFLQMNHSPQMPQMQMPQMTDYGAMYTEAALRSKQQEDQYEAHLKQKRALEEEQAAAIQGHESELTSNPDLQAILKSGNAQMVAEGMRLVEDEWQKKLAAQYNENPTFTRYQEALAANPELARQMMDWKRAGGTTVNVGEKSANDITWMTPAQKAAVGLDPSQPYAINQKTGMPEAVKPNEFTDKQNQATGFYNRMSVAEQALDEEMKNGFTTGTPKEAIANALPYGLGGFLRTPQMQRVRQAQEDWVRAKLRLESGAAIPPDEMDREIQTYFPGLNETDPTIIEQKRKSRQQALSQVQESTGFKQNKGDHNGSYDAIIEAAAAKHGIDPELVKAVIHQESGGNPKAVSSAGAGGMMQLMPDTAKQLGVSDVTDPAQNIFAGTDYLTQQIKKYGDVALGLAAYNAGPGAVDKYKGIPPYAETKGYVTNIVGDYAAKKAKQKEDAISTARQFTQNSPVNQETAKKLARINALRAKGGLPTLNELPTNKGS